MTNHPGDPRSDANGEIPFNQLEYPYHPYTPPAPPPQLGNVNDYQPFLGAVNHGVRNLRDPEDGYAVSTDKPYSSDQAAQDHAVDQTSPRDLIPVKPIPVTIVDKPDLLHRRPAKTNTYTVEASKTPIAPPVIALGTTSTTGGTYTAGTYYWRMTALNAYGETSGSNEVSATLVDGGTQQITWAAVPGAIGYYIYRGTAPGQQTGRATNSPLGGGQVTTTTMGFASVRPVPDTNTTGLQRGPVQILPHDIFRKRGKVTVVSTGAAQNFTYSTDPDASDPVSAVGTAGTSVTTLIDTETTDALYVTVPADGTTIKVSTWVEGIESNGDPLL